MAKEIPNMKVSRPNTVGYNGNNKTTTTKSQTMAP